MMGLVINGDRYKADMEELKAYRATGLTPLEVMALVDDDPAPAPLHIPPGDDDDFSLAAGILVDDDDDPALAAQEAYQAERWTK